MSDTAVVPTPGMRVTWTDPFAVHPQARRYLKEILILEYGLGDMTILTATQYPIGWIVTLERDGQPLRCRWWESETPPAGWVGEVMELNWEYLRPL